MEGHGSALITDVNLSTSYVSKAKTPDHDQKEAQLREVVEKLDERKKIEDQESERIKQEKKFWDSCLESLARVNQTLTPINTHF